VLCVPNVGAGWNARRARHRSTRDRDVSQTQLWKADTSGPVAPIETAKPTGLPSDDREAMLVHAGTKHQGGHKHDQLTDPPAGSGHSGTGIRRDR